MPKKLIKRLLPDHETIRNHKHLRVFGRLLHDPNLWHLNRRSASGAFAVGLLMAFVPLPTQMLLAAAGAILFRVNLPLAVALVWLTNPITMPPIFYFCYRVGTWVLQTPPHAVHFALTWQWLETELVTIWKPFLLGCAVMGSLSAAVGYGLVRLLWRLQVVRHYQRKREERRRRETMRQS